MVWPRSLFARNALLIAGLVIGGQIVSIACYVVFIQFPRAERLADLTGRYIAVLEAASAGTPVDMLQRVIVAEGRGLLRFERERPARPEAGRRTVLELAVTRRFLDRLKTRFGGRDIQLVRDPALKLWVEMRIGGERFWFVTDADELIAEHLTNWIVFSGFGILIGLAGAFLIQRRINRPLDRLAEAARQVGAGLPGARLDENGPTELAALAKTFNRMVDDLARVEQNRAIMLAGISHDVRTPLTRIRLASELLHGTAEPELLSRINANLARVDRIMSQFLSFARDESAEEPAYLDLNGLITERCAEHRSDGREVGLDLSAVPRILLRPLAFGRVLDNLIANAFAHGAPPVSIMTGFDGRDVQIRVCDRGAGIPAAETERLIQPFQRRGETRAESAGLGLAIVERIVRLHRGSLAFGPGADGGFCVAIRLPLA